MEKVNSDTSGNYGIRAEEKVVCLNNDRHPKYIQWHFLEDHVEKVRKENREEITAEVCEELPKGQKNYIQK